MAWDTERTRRLLLEAATTEFSQFGFAGARVDRISREAGVNKERIYQYFGDKGGLFAEVVAAELARAVDEVPINGAGVEAAVGYAATLFDYHRRHPELARLTLWEGLESDLLHGADVRIARADAKIAALRIAMPGLGEDAARELMLTILTLILGYEALPHLDRLYRRESDDVERRWLQRRAFIERSVRSTALDLLERDAGSPA